MKECNISALHSKLIFINFLMSEFVDTKKIEQLSIDIHSWYDPILKYCSVKRYCIIIFFVKFSGVVFLCTWWASKAPSNGRGIIDYDTVCTKRLPFRPGASVRRLAITKRPTDDKISLTYIVSSSLWLEILSIGQNNLGIFKRSIF
jgi:hypothetical protein